MFVIINAPRTKFLNSTSNQSVSNGFIGRVIWSFFFSVSRMCHSRCCGPRERNCDCMTSPLWQEYVSCSLENPEIERVSHARREKGSLCGRVIHTWSINDIRWKSRRHAMLLTFLICSRRQYLIVERRQTKIWHEVKGITGSHGTIYCQNVS